MLFSQPQLAGAQVDWSNPLSRGLEFVFNGASPAVDVASRMAWTRSGSPTSDVGPSGIGANFQGIAAPYTRGKAPSPTAVAFAALVYRTGSGAFFNLAAFSGTNTSYQFGDGGAGSTIGISKGGVAALSTVTIPANEPVIVVASHDSATGAYWITARGLKSGTINKATQTETSAPSASNGTITIHRNAASNNFVGHATYIMGWRRYMSAAEGQAILDNPWLLFSDPADQLLLAAVGANFSHTGSGGLSFSGAATTVEANDYTATGAGGLALGGAATTSATSDYQAAGAGGITFAGTAAASVSGGYDFIAAGGLVLSGAAGAAFTVNHVFSPGGGIQFGGAATASASESNVATGSGGLVFSGSADAVNLSRRHGGSGGAEDALRARRIQARTEEEEIAIVVSVLAAAGVFS